MAVRVKRPSFRSNRSHAKSTRKTEVRTSESVSEPASSHWSLWNVTVRMVSRKSPSSTGCTSTRSRGSARGGAGSAWLVMRSPRTSAASSSTRALPREPVLVALRELDRGQPAVGEPPVQVDERGADPVDVVGRDDDARARLADEVRGGAVGRHDRQDRAAGGDVLVDLPGEHAFPAAAGVGHEEEQRLRVALEPQRLRARRVRDELEAVAELERLGPLAVGRAEVADEAGDRVEVRLLERLEERPGIALAEEAPRVGDPEPRARHVLEPCEVVEVAAVRDHADGALRIEPAHLVRDRLRHARDRVGASRDELRDLLGRGLAGTRGRRVVATVLVGDERVAQVGDPASARRASARPRRRSAPTAGGEVVITASIPSRRAMRIAAGIAVRFQVTLASGSSRRRAVTCAWSERAFEPLGRAELLRRFPRAWADVAHTMDPRLGRDAQVGVAVHPLRVVGREHVGLDAERREVLRELERPLHASSARGREVHRHEEHLHGCEG